MPTSPLDGARAPSLHSCWVLSLHQKPHTAHVGLCGLQIAFTACEPVTGNSAWGHTHRRQRCRLGDTGGDHSFVPLCWEAQRPPSLPAEISLKGMQAEFLEHSQVLLTWLLCFLNITTRYGVVQQEGSSPREAPSKPHSVLAVSCSLLPISSQERLYRVFPLP